MHLSRCSKTRSTWRNDLIRVLFTCLLLFQGAAQGTTVLEQEWKLVGPENPQVAEEVYETLRSHLEKSAAVPAGFDQDLRELAVYFSRYEPAARLIARLRPLKWSIEYRPGTWAVEVAASPFEINAVTVHADTRSAVRIYGRRACLDEPTKCLRIPADALLHELLHVELILLDKQRFLAQRAPATEFGECEHENEVIEREARLFAEMTTSDRTSRPMRRLHQGTLFAVGCVTCFGDDTNSTLSALADNRAQEFRVAYQESIPKSAEPPTLRSSPISVNVIH